VGSALSSPKEYSNSSQIDKQNIVSKNIWEHDMNININMFFIEEPGLDLRLSNLRLEKNQRSNFNLF
jgi:hypothetical protein